VARIQNNDAIPNVKAFMKSADAFEGANADKFKKKQALLAEFLLEADTQKAIRNGFRMYQWKINGKEDLFDPIAKAEPDQAFEDAFVKKERINPSDPLIYIGTTERITIEDGKHRKEMKGRFPTFVSNDKLYIVPPYRVKKVKNKVEAVAAREAFEDWHHYDADELDYEIDFPAEKKAVPVGTALKIWYASDKVISDGDRKGTVNHYVHAFDPGKRPAAVKGDVLVIGNIAWDGRGLLN
jgi:hypothetical protein